MLSSTALTCFKGDRTWSATSVGQCGLYDTFPRVAQVFVDLRSNQLVATVGDYSDRPTAVALRPVERYWSTQRVVRDELIPCISKGNFVALCHDDHSRYITATLELETLAELMDRHHSLSVPDGQLMSAMNLHAFIKVTNQGNWPTVLKAGEGSCGSVSL